MNKHVLQEIIETTSVSDARPIAERYEDLNQLLGMLDMDVAEIELPALTADMSPDIHWKVSQSLLP